MFQLRGIQFAEAVKPKQNFILIDWWLDDFLLRDADLQFLFLLFKGFQSLFGRRREDTHLNRVEQIVNAILTILQLLSQLWEQGAFLTEIVDDFIGGGKEPFGRLVKLSAEKICHSAGTAVSRYPILCRGDTVFGKIRADAAFHEIIFQMVAIILILKIIVDLILLILMI